MIEPEASSECAQDSLARALYALDSAKSIGAFMRDLCTPAELEALTDRWRVVPYILAGMPYREIHERTAVSITTIGRVARCINNGEGGYQAAIVAAPPRGARRVATRSKASA